MKRLLWLIGIACLGSVAVAADLDVRRYYLTNDVASARSTITPLKWYQGESVKMDLYARRGTTAVDLSASGLYAVWIVAGRGSGSATTYLSSTGTVANATNGYVTFAVTPSQANLPTNTYDTWVQTYQPSNGAVIYAGTIFRGSAEVYYLPSVTNAPYTGATTLLTTGNNSMAGAIPFSHTNSTDGLIEIARGVWSGWTNRIVLATNAVYSIRSGGGSVTTNSL